VLIEYFLPLCSKRVDVLLVGTHPKTGAVSAIVWENKQWTFAEIEAAEDLVVTVLGRRLLHPQQQVHDYVQHITDFNQLAQEGQLTVSGLAFLHNATAIEIQALRPPRLGELAGYPLFSGDETGGLRRFLTERLAAKDAARAADDFLTAKT